MADYEADNAAVRKSRTQVPGEMNLFRGNMETILEILQTQRASTSANPTAANVTHAAGVTNDTAAIDATIETPMETVTPTAGNRQLVPADLNRLAAAYP